MERTEEVGLPQQQEGGAQEPHVVLHRHWPTPRLRRFWRNPQHFKRVSPKQDATVWMLSGGKPVAAPILFPV